MRDIIRSKFPCPGIKLQQKSPGEGGNPDGSMGVAGDLHKRIRGTWHCEKAELARTGVKAANMVAASFGKPDYALRINTYPIWIELLDAPVTRNWELLDNTRVRVKPPQRVGIEFRKPYVSTSIERNVIWGTWQCQSPCCITRVGYRQCG